MPYRKCTLGLLVQVEPERAARRILAAYERAGGNTARAAEALQVHRRSLERWVGTLGLHERVEAIREAA